MTKKPSLRAGTAALHLLLLAGAALPLASIGAPAAAQVTAAQLQPWDGVWRWTANNENWIDLDASAGELKASVWRQRNGGVTNVGSVVFDFAESTPSKLVGTLSWDQKGTFPAEMTLAPDGRSLLLQLTMHDRGTVTYPMYFRRVSQVGDMAGKLTYRQVEDRLRGRWKTPFGDLLIDGERGREEGTVLLTGKVFRTDGTTVRYLLGFHHFEGGIGSEMASWSWTTPTDNSARSGLSIVVSPDGTTLTAVDNGTDPLAGRRNWTATRADVSAQPAPAPTPGPAPAPRPAPPTGQQPSTPAAGTAEAGVFHPLENFDVRLDEARAARDGKVHLFLTVRNRSGRERTVGAGLFTAVMSDAEGVGVFANLPYRATGEEPTAFEGLPAVPAGGEFRLRYVLAPPMVHGPLQRVSIRESGRKALFFAVGHADPGAEASPPPPAGGGAFKPLSKFDVRIDRVVPARDGKLEAFLTLRNATQEVQTTSKGAIKLSAMSPGGAKVTSVSILHSARGERAADNELPLLVYVEPGQEARLRYRFDEAIAGPITVSDGKVDQTFTPGG